MRKTWGSRVTVVGLTALALATGVAFAAMPHVALFAEADPDAAVAAAPAAPVAATAAVADAASDVSGVTMLGVAGRANATPSVAAEGRFVAVAWGVAAGEKKSDVLVAISRDGGATFAAPVRVNVEEGEGRLGGELPPRVVLLPPAPVASASAPRGGAADPAARRRDANPREADPDVAVLWTARSAAPIASAANAAGSGSGAVAAPSPGATLTSIKISRSRDGGRTFEAPVALQASGAAGDRGWPALAADPRSGTLHAIWLDHRGLAANRSDHSSGMSHGASHGSGANGQHGSGTSASGNSTSRDAATHDGVAMAQRSGLYYASLTSAAPSSSALPPSSASSPAARAAAWPSPEREVTPGVCYCCKTALAVRRDGTMAAAWRQVYPGNIRDIAFAVSRDGGRTFSTPVRVSEDRWEINGCPDDGPSIAVGPDDTFHIVWPTVLMKDDEPEAALFHASTRDGRTFTPRQRIATLGSPKPMHPQVAVDPAGRVMVAWDEFVNGQRVAALRTLPPASGPASGSAPAARDADAIVTLAAGAAAQYPAIAATRDGAIAVWTSGPSAASTIAVRRVTPR